MKWFGREPALWLAAFSGVVMLFSAFVLQLSDRQQAVTNAVAAALAGLITAWVLHREGILAAVLGLIQAGLAFAAEFGWNMNSEKQASLMAGIALVLGLFVRQNAQAPIDANMQPVVEPHTVTPR